MAESSVAMRYIADQSPDKAALLKKLHALVMKGMPDAEVALKWGVPVYVKGGRNVCAIAAFKEHVMLNLFVPASVLPDPEKRLAGGKTSRALKVRSASDIDAAAITRWVKLAAAGR